MYRACLDYPVDAIAGAENELVQGMSRPHIGHIYAALKAAAGAHRPREITPIEGRSVERDVGLATSWFADYRFRHADWQAEFGEYSFKDMPVTVPDAKVMAYVNGLQGEAREAVNRVIGEARLSWQDGFSPSKNPQVRKLLFAVQAGNADLVKHRIDLFERAKR